jgi:hypothetical protein
MTKKLVIILLLLPFGSNCMKDIKVWDEAGRRVSLLRRSEPTLFVFENVLSCSACKKHLFAFLKRHEVSFGYIRMTQKKNRLSFYLQSDDYHRIMGDEAPIWFSIKNPFPSAGSPYLIYKTEDGFVPIPASDLFYSNNELDEKSLEESLLELEIIQHK